MDKSVKYCFSDTKEPLFWSNISFDPEVDEFAWGWIDGGVEFHIMSEKDADELLAAGKIVTETSAFSSFTIEDGMLFGSEMSLMPYSQPAKSAKDKPELGVIKLPATYDATLVNADIELDDLVSRMQIALKKEERPDCISILFDGVPGTGKTMAAAYLADQLGMKLKSHKLGEILGKYVGETEKSLQKAFDEAEEEGYVLHFDEIDSLAGDRSTADRKHETKAVNALLQCMDTFKGIFIGTTNSKKELDTAIKRRFLLKKEFKNVTSEQADKLSKLFFKRKAPTNLPSEVLAPADFALVKNTLLFVDDAVITKKYLKACLLEEAGERNGTNGKNKRIGFVL